MKFNVEGTLLENVNLAKFNTWRVGANTRYLFRPASISDLQNFLTQLNDTLPIIWLGLGSNVLLRSKDFPGVVILTHPGLTNIEILNETQIKFEAGLASAKAARACVKHGLAQATFLAGIPGTIGGGLAMNAGAFGGETWEHVDSVYTINSLGEIRTRAKSEFEIGYREVKGLAENEWFISAVFDFPRGDANTEQQALKKLLKLRSLKQPIGQPSCGSVFRNPKGGFAAQLIESCGLKGFKLGTAEVSNKHANFIVHSGLADAKDIELLIKHIQKCVKEKHDVLLEREVRFLPID